MSEQEWYCPACGVYMNMADLMQYGKAFVCPYCFGPVTVFDERFIGDQESMDMHHCDDEDTKAISVPKYKTAACVACGKAGPIGNFMEVDDFELLALEPGEEVPAGICRKCQHFAYVVREAETTSDDVPPQPTYSAFEDDEYEVLMYYLESVIEFMWTLTIALEEHEYLPTVSRRCRLLVDRICVEANGFIENPFDEEKTVVKQERTTIPSGV